MTERKEVIRIRLEYKNFKEDVEAADPNEAFRVISGFLSQIPAFDIASKLTYFPDVMKIAGDLVGTVTILPEGPIIEPDLPTRKALCLSLVGAYVGERLGKLKKESLSAEELAKLTRKDEIDVRKRLSELIRDGLVERTNGEFKITTQGIKRTEEEVIAALKGGK